MPAPFVTRQSKTRVQRDPERGAGHSENGDETATEYYALA